MATGDPDQSQTALRAPGTTAHVFAVRVWKERLTGGFEYRGSVREVRTDAFGAFRDWPSLIGFIVARVEHRDSALQEGGGGGRDVGP